MANPTFQLIASATVGSGGGSVSFANIPQTYTDLLVKASTRSTRSAGEDGVSVTLNGNGATSWVLATANGSTTTSGTNSSLGYGNSWSGRTDAASNSSSTFGNFELYIPNYASNNAKVYSSDAVMEDKSSIAYMSFESMYLSTTTPVSTLAFVGANANLAQYSTVYLYGIQNY
jgi:hypothetical protein